MAKHFEIWLAIQHIWLAMKNYMMHFPLELATVLTTLSQYWKTAIL